MKTITRYYLHKAIIKFTSALDHMASWKPFCLLADHKGYMKEGRGGGGGERNLLSETLGQLTKMNCSC